MYLALSGISAVSAMAFYASSERDVYERRKLQQEFDAMLEAERVKARAHTAAENERLKGAPSLWNGTLTAHDSSLQGHLMLRNARSGSSVEVLEENVGADQQYLTVRDATGAVGLYPIKWVRREGATPA